jgi:hypothetical protein
LLWSKVVTLFMAFGCKPLFSYTLYRSDAGMLGVMQVKIPKVAKSAGFVVRTDGTPAW